MLETDGTIDDASVSSSSTVCLHSPVAAITESWICVTDRNLTLLKASYSCSLLLPSITDTLLLATISCYSLILETGWLVINKPGSMNDRRPERPAADY